LSPHRILVILVILVIVTILGSAGVVSSRAASVTLIWTAPGQDSLVGRAARYDLRYSTQMIMPQNFLPAVEAPDLPLPAAPGTVQSCVLDGLPSGVVCYFAIKTVDQAGNWSAMSNVIACVPRATPALAPALLTPEDGAMGVATVPTLVWQASSGATSYRLQVGRTPVFGSPLMNHGGIVGTSFTFGALANDSTYYWRVQASGEGGSSAWSIVRSFRTLTETLMAPAATALLTPEDGATGVATVPTLVWQASGGATSYRLQVGRTPVFGSLLMDHGGIVGTSFTFGALANDSTYYWRVQASGEGGSSAWSIVRSFRTLTETLMAPAATVLLTPEDGATGVATGPTLAWQASGGATSYRLQVGRTPEFGSPLVDQGGIVGTSYAVSSLASDSTYYWRVQASGEDGSSAWSSVSSFRTVAGTASRSLPGLSFSVPRPNPARDLSLFECTLPEAAQVRVEVFDLAGRRMRLLADEPCAAGPRELVFDLRDDRGRQLAAGVYLVRAQVGRTPFMCRLVIVH